MTVRLLLASLQNGRPLSLTCMCYSIFIDGLLRSYHHGPDRLHHSTEKLCQQLASKRVHTLPLDRSPVFGKVSLSKRGHLLLSVNFSFSLRSLLLLLLASFYFFLAIIVGKVQYREALCGSHFSTLHTLGLLVRHIGLAHWRDAGTTR